MTEQQSLTRQNLVDKIKQFANFHVTETTGFNSDYLKVPFTTISYGERVLFVISDTVANSIQINSLDNKRTYDGVFTQVLSYATQYALTPILDRQLEKQALVDQNQNFAKTFAEWANSSKDKQTTVDQEKDSNDNE